VPANSSGRERRFLDPSYKLRGPQVPAPCVASSPSGSAERSLARRTGTSAVPANKSWGSTEPHVPPSTARAARRARAGSDWIRGRPPGPPGPGRGAPLWRTRRGVRRTPTWALDTGLPWSAAAIRELGPVLPMSDRARVVAIALAQAEASRDSVRGLQRPPAGWRAGRGPGRARSNRAGPVGPASRGRCLLRH